jgi:diguanylate cyclase (GGDEF)-like protein
LSSILLIVTISAIAVLLTAAYLVTKKNNLHLQTQLKDIQNKLQETTMHEQELVAQVETQQKQLRLAFEDVLTGLPGWQLFQDRIEQNIKHSMRHNFALALLVIDIDDFDILNDAFGVETGDEILREVGVRIQSCLRQVDSACRLNKDMFAVLLTQITKPEAAVIATQRILQAISQPLIIKTHQLHLSASIGLSLLPQDCSDAPTLLRNAEHALGSAKSKGRHTYQFYQESMQARSQRELLLCSGLTSETLLQELQVNYEPIIDMQDKSILCMDAVVSWQHPELGVISADELYQYAERQRMVNAITEWLLEKACQKFIAWQSLQVKPHLLGIPLTIKQLENSNFVYRLSLIMQEAGFQPENLFLEIRDNSTLSSFDILEKSFNMLKYLNVKIGVTNFGSGALSLRYIKNLMVNYIKLEPVMIDDIALNQRDNQLLKSILEFANNLSMQVIVQGVENQEQADLLLNLGCVYMQGRLFNGILADNNAAREATS